MNEIKFKTIGFRVTDEEYELLIKISKESELNLSLMIRTILFNDLGKLNIKYELKNTKNIIDKLIKEII